jgi:Arc/MetJ-type ribon-helix-helix transcriptional regulator
MAVSGERTRRTVNFTGNDQALLGTIEELLETDQYSSFSDLCKQALRSFLLEAEPSQALLLFVQLQRQVTALELRLSTLEHQALEQQDHPPWENRLQQLDTLDAAVQSLNQRVDSLSDNGENGSIPQIPEPEPEPEPEVDPLISHLSGLLEEF